MLSLYRRHRPKTFDQVVGQESVVRTLRNAIELGKVHHAYLFVGSRGTGKTSMAKLLACALNAEGGPRTDFSPDDPVCRAIMEGKSLDVVEMDAASNNSVDDIRELRENVALAPMGGGKRVYILDEAHMLSPAAWNAFLKTLEEPPSHVVFVLATTEAHKVPATIVDRCHRFDFRRPTIEQIADVLKRVAGEEDITLPDQAVGLIARKAAGSFRDALGTLEQLVTYGGSEVQVDTVMASLGVADAEMIFEATDSLIAAAPKDALLTVNRLAGSGSDYEQFMRDLSGHLRQLLVTQIGGGVPDSFAVTAQDPERLGKQAEALGQAELLRAIDLLAAAIAAVKDGSEPRLQLEVALLKATQPQSDQSLQALMFRIDQLEARIGGAAAPAVPDAPADTPPPPAPKAAVVAGGASVAVAVEVEDEEEPTAAIDLERIVGLWSAVADAVREQNAMVAALVSEAVPSALDGDRLTVSFPADAAFLKKKAEANRDLVLGALRTLTGRGIAVAFDLSESALDRGPRTLGEEELLERLRRDFGAEELEEETQE
jgi:DNA polymerase-3 subunit gamma/tau